MNEFPLGDFPPLDPPGDFPPTFQPQPRTGWRCPNCHAGNSPDVQQCPCSFKTFTAPNITFPPFRPAPTYPSIPDWPFNAPSTGDPPVGAEWRNICGPPNSSAALRPTDSAIDQLVKERLEAVPARMVISVERPTRDSTVPIEMQEDDEVAQAALRLTMNRKKKFVDSKHPEIDRIGFPTEGLTVHPEVTEVLARFDPRYAPPVVPTRDQLIAAGVDPDEIPDPTAPSAPDMTQLDGRCGNEW